MPEELRKKIEEFHDALEKAQDLRCRIINYLEDECGMTDELCESYNWLENDCDWCYGINVEYVEEMLKEIAEWGDE